MNKKQVAAATQLKRALNACHAAELQGGVFDGRFCIWPTDADPNPADVGLSFFDAVEEAGTLIQTPMSLDGGAGV